MTEDTGFEPEPEDVPAGPEPDAEPVAAPEPGPDAEAAPDPAEDAAEPPAPEVPAAQPPPPAWLTDLRTQSPGSTLLEFAEDVHRRLRNLGG